MFNRFVLAMYPYPINTHEAGERRPPPLLSKSFGSSASMNRVLTVQKAARGFMDVRHSPDQEQQENHSVLTSNLQDLNGDCTSHPVNGAVKFHLNSSR